MTKKPPCNSHARHCAPRQPSTIMPPSHPTSSRPDRAQKVSGAMNAVADRSHRSDAVERGGRECDVCVISPRETRVLFPSKLV